MKQARLLLIDDDPDFIEQQRIPLEAAGYLVETADNSTQAREIFLAATPDIILVDLMMERPDSGISLSHFFKKSQPGVPVILLTGVTRETGISLDRPHPGERNWLQADRLMAKPVRFEQLRREIEGLLHP